MSDSDETTLTDEELAALERRASEDSDLGRVCEALVELEVGQ